MKRNIIIGGAWPYANSSLHLGHIAGLISGDVLARYYRLKGDNVLYVSGSDCHGTPITERARKEGTTPRAISEKYNAEFNELFNKLEFSYDLFSKTDTDFHKTKVQQLFKKLYDNGFIYEKMEKQAYCEHCEKFLQDRDVVLTCPECGNETKGDQCDTCLHVPTDEELATGKCIICGSPLVQKDNNVLYFALSKFQKEIEKHTKEVDDNWRVNAKNETWKYLKQGLKDRAVSRDIEWGVEIPLPNYEKKRLYVWIDAVLGYLTDTMKLSEERGFNWRDFWKEGHNNKIYMCHGKDNIVFHSIILNALLLGQQENYKLVDMIVSAEYLNFNDQKFSKSKGIGMTALEALEKYDADSLRYHLIANGPEKKDTNFTIEDFENIHYGELLNKFGNLVNRTLNFRGLDKIEKGTMNPRIETEIRNTYKEAGELIEKLEFRAASERILKLVEETNKYYDEEEPWNSKKTNINRFNDTIYTCATAIANLGILFSPITPGACEKICKYLDVKDIKWEYREVAPNIALKQIEPLFVRFKNT